MNQSICPFDKKFYESDIGVTGIWRNDELYWIIEDLIVSSEELAEWCYLNLLYPWGYLVNGLALKYHTNSWYYFNKK